MNDIEAAIYLHAEKQFDYGKLGRVTQSFLRRTTLKASADGKIGGLTVRDVDKALEAASPAIATSDRIAIKMELHNAGIMRNF
jgi:hypothetical protein